MAGRSVLFYPPRQYTPHKTVTVNPYRGAGQGWKEVVAFGLQGRRQAASQSLGLQIQRYKPPELFQLVWEGANQLICLEVQVLQLG